MKQTLNRHEKRNQRTAVIVMLAITVPILLIYGSFFKMAFFDDAGNFTLGNFQFLYKGMELKQTKIEPVGKALTNSIFFTVVVTVTEVVISCLSGYAISRLEFRGRKFIQYALLVLRMFPHLLLLIGVLYVLGMFMETLATIIILVPVLLPMILQLGIDPIHFGIVLVVTNNVAMLTPPLGVNLFVASRIAGISVERISVAVIPYLIALTLCILLFTYVPAISTWLPSLMGYGQ